MDSLTANSQTASLKLGIWNGAATCGHNRLLYRDVLVRAMTHGLLGATAVQGVEGSRGSEAFRTVENEVASNELPILVDFVDATEKILQFVEPAIHLVKGCGVVVVEGVEMISQDSWLRETSESLRSQMRAGLLLEIYLLERHMVDGKPAYQAVAEYLRHREIAWVSTARGICGFGKQKRLHKATFWRKNDVPVMMTIVDDTQRLEPCVSELMNMLGELGVVTARPVYWHSP